MLVVTLFGALAAIAAAVFAFVQAKAATDSRADALSAAEDTAKAREDAFQIAREVAAAQTAQAAAAKRSAPGDWGPLRRTLNEGVALTNSTGSAAVIESITLAEGAPPARVYFNHQELPATVDHGDQYEFMLVAYGSGAQVCVTWRPEGSDAPRTTIRTLPAR